jgi:DNA-binding MarR family transcriptional regulator
MQSNIPTPNDVAFGCRERALLLAAPPSFRRRKGIAGGLIVDGHNLDSGGGVVTEESRVARVAACRAAKHLEERGLVERRRGRRIAIALTERGVAVAKRLREGEKAAPRPPSSPSPSPASNIARFISRDAKGAAELMLSVADPVYACEFLGLSYAELTDEERDKLQQARRLAIRRVVAQADQAVREGDHELARWLDLL